MKNLSSSFTPYQKLVVALLTFLNFTIVLDFMILSPLGAILMPALKITPAQFGLVVSAYAFSAGIAGILAAGFADKFDRKKLLLFFYAGFLVGTLLCGIASSYPLLLAARIVTGIFGGVMSSVAFAIVTDLFPYETRGRVMGLMQSAFAASQVLGIPFSLYLANRWGWQSAFFLIVTLGALVFVAASTRLEPIDAHLALNAGRDPLQHWFATVSKARYVQGFLTTALLSIGGFMLMPFASKFTVNNLGVAMGSLPLVYLVTGCAAIMIGPAVGRACDKIGPFPVFTAGTLVASATVLYYTRLGTTPLVAVIAINVVLFFGIFSRMIPSQTMMSALPSPQDRGAFMAVSSAIQQLAGGVASVLAGLIVVESADGSLLHFERVGYVVVAASAVTWSLMLLIQRTLRTTTPTADTRRAA